MSEISNLSISYNTVLFLPLALYIILSVLFGVYEAFRNKTLEDIIFLPFIYPMIHVSYGVGMIYGYIRKLI
jgi:hypothetical protein